MQMLCHVTIERGTGAPALVSGFCFAFKGSSLGTVVPVHPAWIARPVALKLTADGAVMAMESACDLTNAEFEHLQVCNHVTLFPRKLCIGHGGCLPVGGLVALLTLPNTRRVLPALKRSSGAVRC